jgi:serpin B
VTRAIGGAGSVPDAVTALTSFAVDFYRKLAAQPGNVVCSPYSVAVALAMTCNGAQGKTADEMATVLHAPDLHRLNQGLNALTRIIDSRAGRKKRFGGEQFTVAIDVANSLWAQRGVAWEQGFLDALARYYGTGMRLVDFESDAAQARIAINAWTSEQTHGKFPELLAPGSLDALTTLILINAIYLKAPWDTPFSRELTRARPFILANGQSVSSPAMKNGLSIGVAEGSGWKAVRLPYAGNELAMTVVLPTSSLTDLEASLSPETLQQILTSEVQPQLVDVTLPRWSFRLASPLADLLSSLGMPTAFLPDAADFSGMTRTKDLSLAAVQHEAVISVDEDGTEAAAVTAMFLGGAAPSTPLPFVVDRPFLFVIHDIDTATPLFLGRVSDPRST